MRPVLLLVLAILLASAAPTALAARAELVLTAPDDAVRAEDVVPVDVAITLSDFMCDEPRAVVVALAANATAGVQASLSVPNVTFEIPAEAYFVRGYQANATVQVAITATQAGTVELAATFAGDDGEPCFAPGGFEPATASATLRVDAADTTPVTMGNETAADNETPVANATETNETAETNATNATDDTTLPNGSRRTGPSCSPDGNCGAIGEYAPPQESQGGVDAPGVGFLLGAAVLAVAALVWRRRKA